MRKPTAPYFRSHEVFEDLPCWACHYLKLCNHHQSRSRYVDNVFMYLGVSAYHKGDCPVCKVYHIDLLPF